MSNRAWVTLATNDSYGLGALVLAHSLRRVGSVNPAVVLITPSVTDAMKNRLSAVFAEVVTVDVLDSRDAAHLALLQRPELGITFTKIHCWSLSQYEKCVFLDADTLVVQNCDELFEREELSAAPDVGWPDCFNSGVFVYKPSSETFDKLIAFAKERGSFDGGDQGLLNSFFSDWAHGDINKHLPFLYNVTSAAFYSYLPALKHYGENLKIIHFIGAAKPWLQHYNWESGSVEAPEHLRLFLQLWWDLFTSQVHSQLDESMVEIEEAPPALSPPDVNIYYAPIMNPDSEFPWHHPDSQVQKEERAQTLDMSQFHDPWEKYKGNVPPMSDDSCRQHSQLVRVENQEELRKYAWEYVAQQNYNPIPQVQESYEHNTYSQGTQQHDTNHRFHYISSQCSNDWKQQPVPSHELESQNYQSSYSHSCESNSEINKNESYTCQFFRKFDENPEYSQYYQAPQSSQPVSNDPYDHHQDHSSNFQRDNELHVSTRHTQQNEPQNIYTQTLHEYKLHDQKHEHDHQEQSQKLCDFTTPTQSQQSRVDQVYKVHLDHDKSRCSRTRNVSGDDVPTSSNVMVNGDISETENEDHEDFRPRHPYDGFYLRHRATIDSRGHKICTHEIPPTPSPPPDSPTLPVNATPSTSDGTVTTGVSDDQTGVAGNLARVVPGAAWSREAMDELTRRQGWEAGNIDYMGADSFANIWAKISQTLSEPRVSPPKQSPPQESTPPKQPSPPPKEPSPPKEQTQPEPTSTEAPASEAVQEPVSAPVEVAKEAAQVDATPPVETAPVPKPTEAAVPAETEVVPEEKPADAAAPVETKAAPEPKPAVAAAPTEPKATVEAVPVVTAAPLEVAQEAPTPVESAPIADQVEVAAPAKVSAPDATSTPAPPAPVTSESAKKPDEKTEKPAAPSEPPVAPKAAPETTIPAVKTAPKVDSPPETKKEVLAETPKVAEPTPATLTSPAPAKEAPTSPAPAAEAPISPAPAVEAPTSPQSKPKTTPGKSSNVSVSSSDSPPLAHTPSKEELPKVPAAKSEERRKPAGKLQLSPPAAADPLPTPDSELEDAATLAQSIIASELPAPTVTSPSPAPSPSPSTTPASPPQKTQEKRLSVEEPEVPTPPVGAVSLAQIGVKPSAKGKSTTAAQIESSLSEKKSEPETPKSPTSPTTPTTPTTPSKPEPATPTDVPKKKVVKKVVKKEGTSSGEAPVPPPRKKEKKPKEK